MPAALKCRQWLLYCVLAVPAVFVPVEDYMGLGRVRFSLGWPVSGMDLLVGDCLSDGRLLHFQPSPMLLPVAAIWVWITQYLWEARTCAVHRPNWHGALIQATITSFYRALSFWFLYGVVNVIWSWRLERPLPWPALEGALRFGRNWLPYLYALGASGVFVALFLDARARRGVLRLFHVGFALTFLIVFCMFLPYLRWQLKEFNEMIQFTQKQQK